ncbi:bifunctional 2-C-methyl-D-erythritol 4-phosphate cytidylyltransferase/2-C-methyl-D-erythritol 2,4-cyclodiphosphate synthase [Azospirillum brasilense]|uniref:bifunctional 2-C-methyl-D-erythritol 4-phosphate cytidylyltransferase/2-C-methyl-D-erythritol 2,4-cyclodiphosphate synthase n=1 Tax=Azospirillum brasilense TaxID=192 RepID=UPI000E69D79C|nr:bifunctional 2-C-methyl-D-erythritol 4-phosphate cytidylyltransferase/2-C-methyl-D-erythritol 2,4-cyclodiphosphate synthase [Azospirillum brasilense]NUB23783.1 bifunctional 2-C-methyl-D-erythritol 4-phosphate cytidylyltransferase/2-C-methyl-D-erythritol 2,4-cyclodiphosphate synthase [Azospirillum brasilense]NUB30298.1 bifunctional 2-C-methyl-D-erythritol 4-phosphate cytidylyltransferase/2-C-methyl-D-erythritol 2,4-cyclodiphosphate synthase [Azospirillum brasilense]RIW06904.1 bifunctional 2-C-
MSSCIALIVAAGSGQRFGAEQPKQYLDLAGQPVLRRTVEAFRRHPKVSAVRVVINPAFRDLYDAAVAGLDLPEPVAGGASRQDSVRNGLEALADSAPGLVLIHDAARPLIDSDTINAVIAALDTHPAALAAVPVTDTLKRGDDGLVAGTVDRSGLWRAQTPQGFRFPAILAAHRDAAGLELTDDAAVAERAGLPVALVPAREENFKVTTPDDLTRATRALDSALSDIRTGSGFDVHRFAEGDHVTLCGVRVPHTQRLDGHSDADVGLHALTDAILGALCAGDIGSHFPPSDPQWRGADSALFLKHAAELVTARGGRIAHVDVTIICERPKVGPHREAMTARVADILGMPVDRVSVKATTTERLGFTGRGEGIAAQAMATIRLPG